MAGIVLIAIMRTAVEFLDAGFSSRFWLYGGFALVASVFEWRHYNKPREISLKLENGRLEYCNHFTGERHTVYQSRTQWIKETPDAMVFFSKCSISTKIPFRNFSEAQIAELKNAINSWNISMVGHGKE
ncbi:MAG TPA: hypothetical protein VK907_13675 [Phnomibacter sp.]|nr:hypothetical protein [Phnomibacter sp.]